MDSNRCKYFIPGLKRCDFQSSEDSDLCPWHNSFYWTSESLSELSKIKFQALGFDITGMDLTDVRAENAYFSSANLRQTVLNSCVFEKSCFKNTQFKESYLSSTRLEDCNLKGSDWDSCELSGGLLLNSDLSGVHFKNTILRQVSTKNCLLSKLKVEQSLFESLDFGSCKWICDTSYEENIFPRFIRTKLKNCLFSNADLSFFRFERCEFVDCHFLDTDLQRVNFRQCTFVDTKFEGVSNIDKSYFDECNFNRSSRESIEDINPNLKFSSKSFAS